MLIDTGGSNLLWGSAMLGRWSWASSERYLSKPEESKSVSGVPALASSDDGLQPVSLDKPFPHVAFGWNVYQSNRNTLGQTYRVEGRTDPPQIVLWPPHLRCDTQTHDTVNI